MVWWVFGVMAPAYTTLLLCLDYIVLGLASGNLFPDQAIEGDQVVERDGSKVLLIGADASDALGDRQVDTRETAPGQVQLVLTKSDEPGSDTRRKPSI